MHNASQRLGTYLSFEFEKKHMAHADIVRLTGCAYARVGLKNERRYLRRWDVKESMCWSARGSGHGAYVV